jgi:hypothetical protein
VTFKQSVRTPDRLTVRHLSTVHTYGSLGVLVGGERCLATLPVIFVTLVAVYGLYFGFAKGMSRVPLHAVQSQSAAVPSRTQSRGGALVTVAGEM